MFFDTMLLFVVKRILNFISSQNIIYIKLLQWTFKESSYLPKRVNEYLNSFRDSAPYTSKDINWEDLDELLVQAKDNKDNLRFNRTPINSGTISIVFEGWLNDNPIVLKTKRKNVERSFQNVESSLLRICRIVEWFSGKDYSRIVKQIVESLFSQCDFLREFDNIQLFHEKSKKYGCMDPIRGIKEYSNENIITMTRSPGVNPTTLNADDFSEFQKKYMKSLSFLFFAKCIVHSDVHYGNILYNPKSKKVTFIDLGMIIKLTVKESNVCHEMAKVALTKPEEFVEYMIKNVEICSSSEDDQNRIVEFSRSFNFVKHEELEMQLLEVSRYFTNLLGQPVDFCAILPSVIVMILSIIRISSEIDDVEMMKAAINGI